VQQELGLSRDQIATLIKLDSESITRPNQGAVQWAKLLHMKASVMLLLVGSTELRRAQRSPSSRSRTRESTTWWLREPRGTTSALWSTNNCRNCRGNHNCRLPGKQEVIPGGVWSFPPLHSYPRQIRPGERGEPKRKSALRLDGQKGCFRSSHKWMIRLIEEFRFGVVPQVYLTDHLGCTDWSCDFESCVSQRGDCQSAYGVL